MPPNLSQEAVREQLARISANAGFKANPRASAFLTHVVERTLAGRAAEIKEATIGVEVFARPPGYNTKSDPVVRSLARVLREKLNDYYLDHPAEEVRIELPKGTYVPVFHQRPMAPAAESPAPAPPRPIPWTAALTLLALMACLAAIGVFFANPRTQPPGDPDALYLQGCEKLLAGDYPGARPLLERAARLAPDRAPVRAALADDLRLLGYDSLALAEAQKAESGIAGLSPLEVLQVEASFRAAAADYRGAIETLSRLQELDPSRLYYRREAARAQMSAADYPACLQTVASAAASSDAQFSLIEAFCRAGAGSFETALRPVRRAAALARQAGVPDLYARARLLESGLLMSTGHIGESRPIREEARRICQSLGDASCVLRALRIQANLDLPTAGPAVALREFRQALPLAKDLGSAGEAINLLRGEAVALADLDDFPGANAALVEALLAAQKAGMNLSGLRLNLADLAIEEGQLARAESLAAEAAQAARQAGDRNTETDAHAVWSKALLLSGDLSGAERCLNESPMREQNAPLPTATVATWLLSNARLNRLAGKTGVARKQLEQAQSLGEPVLAGDLAIEQIELSLDQRDYREAQRRAGQALAARNLLGVSESLQIAALLSDAYGWDGQLDAARQALAPARARVTTRSATLARLRVLISAGRWAGNPSEADRSLEEAIALARDTGFRLAEAEARRAASTREHGGAGPIARSTH